jgi:uncharacterized membrane protein YhhN
MTFGLVALALGHHSSVLLELPQQRWRFTGGRLLPVGALQAVGGMALGFLEYERGLVVLVVVAVVYVASLSYHGRRWESGPARPAQARSLAILRTMPALRSATSLTLYSAAVPRTCAISEGVNL